jgi:serine/threonine-protein kinase
MTEHVILNNRYQLEERLGTGGMAVVYRSRDLMLERPVAIKILRENFSDDPDFRERFRQEARAAANLSHPNIVTVHDFGLDAGRLFIVMEYVPGTDLKSILQRRSKFSIDDAIALMVQACAGVGYAHRAGLVHCDIKPHNMLIAPDKRLKVTDFGIARALATIHPEEKAEIVWGSPQYFSPEQASGEAPSPASDVYSLGIVLYEMLTGQLPFIAGSATELIHLHRDVPPPPPRQYNPQIPPALEQIILKVLSKEPAARYRTADQFGRVLVSFSQQTSTVTPVTFPQFTEDEEAAAGHFDTSPRRMPRRAPQHHYEPEPILQPIPEPIYEETVPSNDPAPVVYSLPQSRPADIDWGTVILGLLALIAVGGLIPLYLWIYFLYQ